MANTTTRIIIAAGEELTQQLQKLRFREPVAFVYNPLEYASAPYRDYILKYAVGRKRVVFLGMNPGPFGMVQTGVPFGEVPAVRDWLRVSGAVDQPAHMHPVRPVLGFLCPRSEISGKRLWGLFSDRFGSPGAFFREHFVLNYCPLAFMEATGRNRTPDKLPANERDPLFLACDDYLRKVVSVLEPEWLIGIGGFAFERASTVFHGAARPRIGQVLHPSPACPASNRDWPGTVTSQLKTLGVWTA